MLLKVTVRIGELKGFVREYIVRDKDTLWSLSKKMGFDLDFPQDQLVLFKAVGPDFGEKALNRYSSVNLGAGTIDIINFKTIVERGEQYFVYFYDTTNKKSIRVIIEGELDPLEMPRRETELTLPTPYLLAAKGPNPIEFEKGYVAFEDQPKKEHNFSSFGAEEDIDDDDLDDDDEDEEEENMTEEAEEIFGEEDE